VKSISLFTGAGGLDIGLEAAGFRPAICVEVDVDARRTVKTNHPNWKLLSPGDIHSHKPSDVVGAGGLRRGEAVLLAAGSPCQPFSKASLWVNGRTAGLGDSRAKTLAALIRIAEAALPQVLLIENVRGIACRDQNGAMNFIERRFKQINHRHGTRYSFSVLHLNAADYGVPQARERTYIIADRDGRDFMCPPATHGDRAKHQTLEPYLTAWDAIGSLDEQKFDDELMPRGKWTALLPSIPEGWNYLWHTNRGGGLPLFGWRTRYWSFLLKLAKARPSWTIPASPGPSTGPFHWRNRVLSPRELARLQTFPDSFKIIGGYRSITRQIGNATPALMAEILGQEIRRQWLDKVRPKNLSLVLQRLPCCPPAEPITEMPMHFRSCIAEHKPHPGIGLGPGALRRLTVQNLK